MNKYRLDLINQAFQNLDTNGDGVITVEDMKGVFNYDQHPEFISGNKTQDQIFTDFLKTFEMDGHVDGKVSITNLLKDIVRQVARGHMPLPKPKVLKKK